MPIVVSTPAGGEKTSVTAAAPPPVSSYQSARWSGVQTINFSRANAARIESTAQSTLAGQQTQLDVATFIAWTSAYAANDTTLSDFYFKRVAAFAEGSHRSASLLFAQRALEP